MTQHNVEFNQSEDENGTDMHCLDIEFIKKYHYCPVNYRTNPIG